MNLPKRLSKKVFAMAVAAPMIASAATEQAADSQKIHPGDARFTKLVFAPYEAQYTSRSSVNGAFTLRVRMIDQDSAISLIDIIPTADNVIVAQRRIDARSHALAFNSGPNFAWGSEFVVQQMGGGGYDWVRVPIGGGKPAHIHGQLENGDVISDMFSPTLAALMPAEPGDAFQLPVAIPRKGGFVSSWWEEYRVLRKERLKAPAGIACDCWVLEKAAPGGGYTQIWVDTKPPFVFRRHFDRGGRREFVSELLGYRPLAHE